MNMPILKSPPNRPKNATIQVRVEEGIKSQLDSYAQFIGANQAYVVSEALRLLFRKDSEFRTWVSAENGNNNKRKEGIDPKAI
jgi:hypothetical protein